MKKLLFLSVVALAACSKSGGGAGGSSSCEASIDHALNGMAGNAAGPMAEVKDKLRVVFVNHCNADKWPAAVTDCFSKAASQPDIKKCRQLLPEDQAKAIQQEIMAMMMDAMQKNGGAGGGMMHGGGMQGGAMHGGGAAPPPAGAGSQDTAPSGNGGTPTTEGAGSAK
ncbi:hypothetical protein BH11MYX2_BH11MYX2_09500 [soil metagenome]